MKTYIYFEKVMKIPPNEALKKWNITKIVNWLNIIFLSNLRIDLWEIHVQDWVKLS